MSYTPCRAEVTELSRDHITVALATGEEFVLPFERYGHFRHCTLLELEHVICDGGALEWPEAMIDLELDLLRHPEKETLIASVENWLRVREKLRQKEALRASAAKAGSVKSARKAAASRKNGALGGRPKKKSAPVTVEQ